MVHVDMFDMSRVNMGYQDVWLKVNEVLQDVKLFSVGVQNGDRSVCYINPDEQISSIH